MVHLIILTRDFLYFILIHYFLFILWLHLSHQSLQEWISTEHSTLDSPLSLFGTLLDPHEKIHESCRSRSRDTVIPWIVHVSFSCHTDVVCLPSHRSLFLFLGNNLWTTKTEKKSHFISYPKSPLHKTKLSSTCSSPSRQRTQLLSDISTFSFYFKIWGVDWLT